MGDIAQYTYEGTGMSRVYENPKWMVGVKNWKPENDVSGITCLERHNETDELFILLSGRCDLVYATEKDGELFINLLEMEPQKVYNIPRRLWHNTVTRKDTKLILVEDSSTGGHNSDVLELTDEQRKALRQLVK